MATLDIFNGDAFTLSAMTAAIQNAPFAPGRLGELGLFGAEQGVNTKSVMIEQYDDVLDIIPVSQRGAPATPSKHGTRKVHAFTIPHIKPEDAILADEVLGVRAFGSESEVETVAGIVGQRLAKMRQNIEYTKESYRMLALKGSYMDAAGNQTSLFTTFGVTQDTVGFDLDNAAAVMRLKVLALLESIEDSLGGLSFSGVRVLCGKNFWSKLIEHKSVKESYLNTIQAAALRGDPRMEFSFCGVTFERYRGTSAVKVGDDEAYAVPEGVVDLFIARNAPADYVETVGTMGQSIYAKQWLMEAGRGIKMEAQANPLMICTRPKVIKKLTVAA
mgnify:CR=1 FL=1